jgi:hypothetical protein
MDDTDDTWLDDTLLSARPVSPAEATGDPETTPREKKIKSNTIAHLLQRARRLAEKWIWEGGLVWHPEKAFEEISADRLAERVLPEMGTPARRACAQEICNYTGDPLSGTEAASWLATKIEERLDQYILRARSKISEIRLVVTERSIEIRAERPDTTLSTVGPLPFSNPYVQTDFP